MNYSTFIPLQLLILFSTHIIFSTDMSYQISIQICSNCREHAWCTRHNQATYLTLAEELKKCILSNISNAIVKINLVSGQKMGSFEVSCKGITLFSKLELGYFPHTTLLTSRIVTFIDDDKKGNDLSKYKYSQSPIKHHPTFKKEYSNSPKKTNVTPNLMLLSGDKFHKKEDGAQSGEKKHAVNHEPKKEELRQKKQEPKQEKKEEIKHHHDDKKQEKEKGEVKPKHEKHDEIKKQEKKHHQNQAATHPKAEEKKQNKVQQKPKEKAKPQEHEIKKFIEVHEHEQKEKSKNISKQQVKPEKKIEKEASKESENKLQEHSEPPKQEQPAIVQDNPYLPETPQEKQELNFLEAPQSSKVQESHVAQEKKEESKNVEKKKDETEKQKENKETPVETEEAPAEKKQ